MPNPIRHAGPQRIQLWPVCKHKCMYGSVKNECVLGNILGAVCIKWGLPIGYYWRHESLHEPGSKILNRKMYLSRWWCELWRGLEVEAASGKRFIFLKFSMRDSGASSGDVVRTVVVYHSRCPSFLLFVKYIQIKQLVLHSITWIWHLVTRTVAQLCKFTDAALSGWCQNGGSTDTEHEHSQFYYCCIDWSKKWDLPINPTKCNYLTIGKRSPSETVFFSPMGLASPSLYPH